MGIESRGFCDRHQLPLDAHGECELCRLSAISSEPPPSRTTSWIVLAVGALLLGAAVFGLAMGREPVEAPPPRGVPAAAPRPEAPTAQARPAKEARPRRDRPSSVPVPLPPADGNWRVQTAPTPPRPQPQSDARAFSEDDAKAALREVRIEMYATAWCGSCRRARAYLDFNGISYTEYDIDRDEEAKRRLSKINPRRSIPTFQVDDIVQIGFSPESLERKLNQAVRARLQD